MRYAVPALAILVASMLWCPTTAAGEFPVQVEETVLSNGLKVFCLKRPGNPQTACILAVRTGSSSEVTGKTGIAHFLEHMLFKGTDKIGVKDPEKDRKLRKEIDGVMAVIRLYEERGVEGEDLVKFRTERDRLFAEQQENLVLNHVFKIYSDAGGSMTNAFTSQDMTAYFSILPNHKIELFFWIEAERFRNPVFRQFHSEKNVVREERRLSENRPGHAFQEEFGRVLFAKHPYAEPVIGSHEDLSRLTRAQMREFFDHFYSPDNMFLMVAGDVDPAAVFKLAERYFGDWKPSEGKRREVPKLRPFAYGPQRVTGSGKGSPELNVAWRMPAAGSEMDVDATLLAMHLGDEEGALTKRLVEERGIATRVRVQYDGMLHGSAFYVTVTMKEGVAPEEAEADVLAAVRAVVDAPLTEERMVTLRRRYRARVLGMVKSDMMLGFRFLRNELTGTWKNIERNLVRSRSVPAEDLHALAVGYLEPANMVVGVYTTAGAPAPEAPATAARPKHWTDLAFPRKALDLPSAEPHVTRLDNGITIVAVPDEDDPVFRVEAILRGGSAEDAAGKEGTAEVLAGTLGLSGTPDLTREKIRERLEEIVGTFAVSADRFSLRFAIDTFPADRAAAVDLLHDLLMNVVPDPDATRTETARLRSRLVRQDARPGALSRRSFRKLLLGDDVRTRRASPASVDAIDGDALAASLARHRDPRRLVLVVSGPFGDVTAERLKGKFAAWKSGDGEVPEIPGTLAADPAAGLHVMDYDSSQGYVIIGARTVSAVSEDYPALWMLRSVLSRRIFNRIRSNEGLAYQASARLGSDWNVPSLFSVVFQTKNPSAPFGISLALGEIVKMAAEGPTDEELATARQAHRASLERALGRSSARAGAFAELVLNGAASDWYPEVRAAIESVTREMAEGDGEHPHRLADFGEMDELSPPAAPANSDTPAAVAGAVVRAMVQADLDALKPLTTGDFAARLDHPGAKEQLARQGAMMSQGTYEVGEAVIEGDEATVPVEFEMARGEQKMKVVMEVRMQRVEGEWRCRGMRPKGR